MIKEKFIKVVRKFNPKSTTTERDLRIFFICFIVSLFFWLLNALSKTYSTNIVYPVQYKEIPNDKVIISELPQKIQLRINGFGFALLRLKMQLNPTPLLFNISKFTNKDILASNDTTFAISSIQLKKQLSHIISSEINIEDIEPSSIYIKFEDIIQKKIKVVPQIKITPKQQFILVNGIKTTPEWVTITGPRSVVKAIKMVYTQKQEYQDISTPIQRLVPLNKISEVSITPNNIRIEANIEQYTEGKIFKKIKTINLPDSISLHAFPKSVEITYTVPISQYKNINESSFDAKIYWDSISLSQKAPIYIESHNQHIHSYSVQPEEVDYIIDKN